MPSVALVVRADLPEAVKAAGDLAKQLLQKKGMELLVDRGGALSRVKGAILIPDSELASRADILCTLGGDGTLLSMARHVGAKSPLMIGINFGRLGFLTEFKPSEAAEILEFALTKKPVGEKRRLLTGEVYRGGRQVYASQALNDVVVSKGAKERLLPLEIFINGREAFGFRADGLIISTPTGSTAYSLAAGGSIVFPTLEVLLFTAIAPHSLTLRPLVLPADTDVSIRFATYKGQVTILSDGQMPFELGSGDIVKVRYSKNTINLLRSRHIDYFDLVRDKLNLAI